MAECPSTPTEVKESDLSFKSIDLEGVDTTVVEEMDPSIEELGRRVYPTPDLPPRPPHPRMEGARPKTFVPIAEPKEYSPPFVTETRESEKELRRLVESQTRLQQDIGKLMSLMVTLGSKDQGPTDSGLTNISRNNGDNNNQIQADPEADLNQSDIQRQHDQFVSRMPASPRVSASALPNQENPMMYPPAFPVQPPSFVPRPPGIPYWTEDPIRDGPSFGPMANPVERRGRYHERGYAWKSFPEADKFTGAENGENFEEWLTKFEFKCRFNGYDDRTDLSDILLLALKDDALNYILGVPNYKDLTFSGLCKVLTKRFGADLAADRQRLQERRKRRDESWQHFADDILRLCARVYPGMPELVEREAKNVFIDSLPSDMRMSISAANPPDLATCVANVKSICSHNPVKRVNWVDSSERPTPFEPPTNNPSNGMPASTNRRPRSPSPGTSNRKEYMKNVRCYNCGLFGHYARWCKQFSNNHVEQEQENDQES